MYRAPFLLYAPLFVALGAACDLGPQRPGTTTTQARVAGDACMGRSPDVCVWTVLTELEPPPEGVEDPPWTPEKRARAAAKLFSACRAGHGQACLLLEARSRTEPYLPIPEGETGLSLAKRSCDLQFEVGCFGYAHARLFEADTREGALRDFKRLCAANMPEACEAVAEYLETSTFPTDQARSAGYYERACAGDVAASCFALASRLAPQRPAEAEWLRQKACSLQHETACEQAPYADLPALPRSHYATHGHSWRRDFSPRPAQP